MEQDFMSQSFEMSHLMKKETFKMAIKPQVKKSVKPHVVLQSRAKAKLKRLVLDCIRKNQMLFDLDRKSRALENRTNKFPTKGRSKHAEATEGSTEDSGSKLKHWKPMKTELASTAATYIAEDDDGFFPQSIDPAETNWPSAAYFDSAPLEEDQLEEKSSMEVLKKIKQKVKKEKEPKNLVVPSWKVPLPSQSPPLLAPPLPPMDVDMRDGLLADDNYVDELSKSHERPRQHRKRRKEYGPDLEEEVSPKRSRGESERRSYEDVDDRSRRRFENASEDDSVDLNYHRYVEVPQDEDHSFNNEYDERRPDYYDDKRHRQGSYDDDSRHGRYDSPKRQRHYNDYRHDHYSDDRYKQDHYEHASHRQEDHHESRGKRGHHSDRHDNYYPDDMNLDRWTPNVSMEDLNSIPLPMDVERPERPETPEPPMCEIPKNFHEHLKEALESGKFTFFFTKRYPFSNHYQCPNLTIDGRDYVCTEQYYMFMKAITFQDKEGADKIIASSDPKEMKNIGRAVKGFRQEIWDTISAFIMQQASKSKYTQNRELRRALFETRGSILVETNPTDCIWGIGLSMDDPRAADYRSWRGQNQLGFILTNLREELWQKPEYKDEVRQIEESGRSYQDAARRYGGFNANNSGFFNSSLDDSGFGEDRRRKRHRFYKE